MNTCVYRIFYFPPCRAPVRAGLPIFSPLSCRRVPALLSLLLGLWLLYPLEGVCEDEKTPVKDSALPAPLTLDRLMQLPLQGVSVLQADARLDAQSARVELAEANDDAQWTLNLTPRYIEPSRLSPNPDNNDSQATLIINKLIYDFGRQANSEDAARYSLEAARIKNAVDKNVYRLNLMKAYFDVILADLAFLRDNEAMSAAYVRLDRLKAKRDLGQVSLLDVSKQEQIYQKERVKYYQSRTAQQTRRSYLAVLMNRPDQLVAEMPDPPILKKRKLPELDALVVRVMENNPALKLQKKLLSASRARLEQARSQRWPRINASAGYYQYQREMPNQNEWSVELNLSLPLWQGNRVSAAVGEAVALQQQQQLEVRNTELVLRQQTHEILESLRGLQVLHDQTRQLLDYRDLSLDLSRARYEQELQSDLGDSMVNVSAAKLEAMRVETQRILTWAKLQALMGMPVYPIEEPAIEAAKSDAQNAKAAQSNGTQP